MDAYRDIAGMNRKGAKNAKTSQKLLAIRSASCKNPQHVILSTATPPGGAYHWNDSKPKIPVILSERSESKNPPKFGVTP